MPTKNLKKTDSASTLLPSVNKDAKSAQHERRPALVSLRGELMAVPIPLERDQVIIGRAIEADVRLNDFRASRLHARITTEVDSKTEAASYRITDLGSTNGTLVNGELITDVLLNDWG
jgi:hypothetical protein